MIIRPAKIEDAEELLKIYAPYVEKTAVSFEYIAPTAEEFSLRIRKAIDSYAYLVAEEDERIVGYVYASSFRSREAYKYSVEVSIYVSPEYHGKGVGKALYNRLFEILRKKGIHSAYAVIVSTERQNDEYLSDASIRFHEHIGFRPAAVLHDAGYKFNRWYSITIMQYILSDDRIN